MLLLYRGKIEVLLKTQIFHILTFRSISFLQGQLHEKDHHSLPALDLDRAFMSLGDGFGNGKPQAVMTIFCSPGLITAVEPFKKMLSLFLGYFPAFICHRQNSAVFYPFQFQIYLFSLASMADPVINKDRGQLFQLYAVPIDPDFFFYAAV